HHAHVVGRGAIHALGARGHTPENVPATDDDRQFHAQRGNSPISSVIRSMVERLIPKASSPISASPDSLRRTRLYDLVVIGSIPGKQSNESVSQSQACVATQARLFCLSSL